MFLYNVFIDETQIPFPFKDFVACCQLKRVIAITKCLLNSFSRERIKNKYTM